MKRAIIILIGLSLFLCVGCVQGPMPVDETYTDNHIEEDQAAKDQKAILKSQEDLIAEYERGWEEAVGEVFSEHDELYYNGVQYTFWDYPVDSSGRESTTDTDAYYEGRTDALDMIFIDTDLLCYGEERYYRDDF